MCRNLIIKCSSYRQAHWWSHEINHLADTCDFLKVQRFDGFAPPRENALTKWFVLGKNKKKTSDTGRLSCDSLNSHHLAFVIGRYVNGSGYFADLADALEQAKEEIFITDWW